MSVFPESPALLVFLLDLQKENFLAPQTDKSMRVIWLSKCSKKWQPVSYLIYIFVLF